MDEKILNRVKAQLDPDQDRDSLLGTASSLLSEMTHMAGIITIPKGGQLMLRQIEFLSLSDNRVLAILVINEKEVQNRVIHVEREYSQDELTRIANYLTQTFTGQDIFNVRSRILQELHQARNDVDDLMKAAVEIANQAFNQDEDKGNDYLLQGQSNLIRFNELDNAQNLQHLFDMFERKRDMLSLLDRCIQAEDIQVFIGREAGLEGFSDCSVITAPYTVEGEILGVLGVIGPSRMQYDKVITTVDITAQLLGLALNPKK